MGLLHILFPRVRAEVLRVLFSESEREVHLRELARQAGLSIKTVQNEVVKLTRVGLLASRRDGNRRLLRAETGHPLFADLQQIILKTSGLRDVLVEALQGLPGIEVAFVFGSLAGGPGRAGSDVDLMVVGNVTLRALAPRLRQASARLGREVNPVSMSAAEFARTRTTSAFLTDVLAKEKLFVKGGHDELERLG